MPAPGRGVINHGGKVIVDVAIAADKAGVPKALQLTLPQYTPAAWYGRVQFPPLKEAKK